MTKTGVSSANESDDSTVETFSRGIHMNRLPIGALGMVLVGTLVAACSAGKADGGDPLIGTWTYSGGVSARVSIALAFKSDRTCTIVETVAPASEPAGFVDTGCTTTDTYLGTYSETHAGGTNTLTLTFTGGTANNVSGCNPDSGDSAGVPMTADSIASYRAQGFIPGTMETYTMSATALVLSPGVGAEGPSGTTFSRSL